MTPPHVYVCYIPSLLRPSSSCKVSLCPRTYILHCNVPTLNRPVHRCVIAFRQSYWNVKLLLCWPKPPLACAWVGISPCRVIFADYSSLHNVKYEKRLKKDVHQSVKICALGFIAHVCEACFRLNVLILKSKVGKTYIMLRATLFFIFILSMFQFVFMHLISKRTSSTKWYTALMNVQLLLSCPQLICNTDFLLCPVAEILRVCFFFVVKRIGIVVTDRQPRLLMVIC